MKNQPGLYFIICFLVVLTSCSISMEKRKYRPGYHIEIVKNQPRTITKPVGLPQTDLESTKHDREVQSESTSIEEEPKEIKSKGEIPVLFSKNEMTKREKKKRGMDSCDVIFTVMGERIQARIIEITDDYVHYKRCDDPKGRLFSLKTKMIDNITLRNGELYIPPNRVIVDKEHERKKSQTLFVMSIVSLVVAFISFVFSFFITPFGTLALIFGVLSGIFSFILAMLDIRPGKYAPSYRTKFTWIFYLIVLALVIATMVLVFL
jgi:hypothetical protein